LGKDNVIPKLEICPLCKEPGCCLVCWGYYERGADDASGQYRIPIKVLKCRRQASGGYISMHPAFLLPYRRYTFAVVYQVLCLRLLLGLTLRASWQQVMGETAFVHQKVQYWVKALQVRCSFWSGMLQSDTGVVSFAANVSGPVRMLTILEQYLGKGAAEDVLVARHGALLNRYRGSPLCHRLYL
jgi:hypothetical protein